MTAHVEAAAGATAPPRDGTIANAAIFLPLFTPFGISGSFVSVALGFQLGRAGLSAAAIAGLVALSIWPQTWKVLWAPLVDTIGDPKLWYVAGAVLSGLTLVAMSVLPATAASLPALGGLVILSSVASTLVRL